VASGGALSAGSSGVGTLTFTHGLTLDTGSVLNFDLGATSDKIVLSGGTLTGPGTAGGVTLNLSDTGTFAAGSYTLFYYSGAALSGFDASSLTLGTKISGYNYSLGLANSALVLTATAVPEPSTWAALAGLAALALVVRRRRAARA